MVDAKKDRPAGRHSPRRAHGHFAKEEPDPETCDKPDDRVEAVIRLAVPAHAGVSVPRGARGARRRLARGLTERRLPPAITGTGPCSDRAGARGPTPAPARSDSRERRRPEPDRACPSRAPPPRPARPPPPRLSPGACTRRRRA